MFIAFSDYVNKNINTLVIYVDANIDHKQEELISMTV